MTWPGGGSPASPGNGYLKKQFPQTSPQQLLFFFPVPPPNLLAHRFQHGVLQTTVANGVRAAAAIV